jgi:hypothetical protein
MRTDEADTDNSIVGVHPGNVSIPVVADIETTRPSRSAPALLNICLAADGISTTAAMPVPGL